MFPCALLSRSPLPLSLEGRASSRVSAELTLGPVDSYFMLRCMFRPILFHTWLDPPRRSDIYNDNDDNDNDENDHNT